MQFDFGKMIYDTADERIEDLIGFPVITGMRVIDLAQNVESEDEQNIDELQGVDTIHNYFLLKSGKLCNLIYPLARKKVTYRPFKNIEELLIRWTRFVSSTRPLYTMPLIWVKYKDTVNKYLITGFTADGIIAGEDYFTWEEALEKLAFLDDTAFGEINV